MDDQPQQTARRRAVNLEDGTPYREEVSSFVDALAQLLEERDIDSIGPSDIAHQANRTVALFFQCFKDERGPLSLLTSRLIADRLETSAASFSPERWQTASLHEIIRSGLDYLVTLVDPDDPVAQAAADASLDDRELMDLRRSALTYDAELFRRLLANRTEELADPEATRAVSLAARTVLVALDRELLLGHGDDLAIDELSDQLVEVVERILGLRSPAVRLAEPVATEGPDEAEAERIPLVVIGSPQTATLLEQAISEGHLGLRVVAVTGADQAIDVVTHDEAPAVFCSWLEKEGATRELLHRVQGSAWLSSLVTVVLTSGSANELSMAYALGARIAVTTPEDPRGFVQLLAQLDRMLGQS